MDYDKLMRTARQTNAKRDEGERESGFAAPPDNEPSMFLRTAMAAIECGIRTDDWESIAEAQAMLEQVIKYMWWMEAELKTIDMVAGGCATYETTLYDFGRDLLEDTIAENSFDSWKKFIERNQHRRFVTDVVERQ